MAPAKERADVLVVAQGLAPSRARAQALIMAGSIIDRTAARVVEKAGALVPAAHVLALRHPPPPYVSRAGQKLAAALDAHAVAVAGLRCLDVGASTGGFTDCLLQRGAQEVVALDVGHSQLAWSLRQDPRVLVREHSNVRTVADDCVPWPVALVVVDVSFISLTLVIPSILRWLAPQATAVLLVKPQFEVGRGLVGKGGIVTDEAARLAALGHIQATLVAQSFRVLGSLPSPILGSKGNQEYLLVAKREI